MVRCFINQKRISKYVHNAVHKIDLLLIRDNDDDNDNDKDDDNSTKKQINKQGYVLIKEFNELVGPNSKDGHKQYYCRTCVHGYPSEEKLNEHIQK